MLENITSSYTGADASAEILLMLAGAFTLGVILAWMLKPSHRVEEVILEEIPETPKTYSQKKKIGAFKDDLKIIEGIGPAIERLLQKNGMNSYQDIVDAGVTQLEQVLESGGSRFQMHSPKTWPEQARLAAGGKWSELEEYQSILSAGK